MALDRILHGNQPLRTEAEVRMERERARFAAARYAGKTCAGCAWYHAMRCQWDERPRMALDPACSDFEAKGEGE